MALPEPGESGAVDVGQFRTAVLGAAAGVSSAHFEMSGPEGVIITGDFDRSEPGSVKAWTRMGDIESLRVGGATWAKEDGAWAKVSGTPADNGPETLAEQVVADGENVTAVRQTGPGVYEVTSEPAPGRVNVATVTVDDAGRVVTVVTGDTTVEQSRFNEPVTFPTP